MPISVLTILRDRQKLPTLCHAKEMQKANSLRRRRPSRGEPAVRVARVVSQHPTIYENNRKGNARDRGRRRGL